MAKKNITQRVQSFEDACKMLNIDPTSLPKESPDDPDGPAFWAHRQLVIIAKALNEGWQPDWSNLDENKYYPWFDLEKGFSFDGVLYAYAASGVGSRLCYRTRELAEHAANHFVELYKTYFTYAA